ncbi:MAG: hypothetical protein AAFO74_16395, partial [Pseudomonadota bacterium]
AHPSQKRCCKVAHNLGAGQETLDGAARTSFLHGQTVIALINRDPLLPIEILGSDAFDEMHAQMVTFDKLGREIWAKFLSKNT